MERNLRELTLDRMLEIGNVQFYERDVDYDKLLEWEEDMTIDIELDFNLKREQELSDMIHDLTIDILKVSDREIKPLKSIQYFDYEGVTIYFTDNSYTYLTNDIVLKGVYKFFKELLDYRKKDIYINTFKSSMEWEVGLGQDLDYGDERICCGQFLLESVIQVIENNILDDDDGII
jgi:hypothetical protein